jgi:hypothetical protein
MDLVERYLHAVGFWLPRAQKRDIVAELSEDIRSEIEEQERESGRALGESDVAALLKQRGHPILVATRYLPQEHLIGPTLFPIYRFVLKLVAACYLVPWVLVWIGFLVFDPAFRSAHGGAGWVHTLGAFWANFWVVGFVAVGVVTLVFAALERTHARSAILAGWDPLKLRAVRDPGRIPRANSIAELAASLVLCGWWIVAASSPVILDRPGVRVSLGPMWDYFFWSYLALWVASIALSGVNLIRPWWTTWRAGFRLATDVIGATLFGLLCGSHIVADISADGLSAARAQAIVQAINGWAERAIPFVVLVGLVIFAFDVYRVSRVRTVPQGPAISSDTRSSERG